MIDLTDSTSRVWIAAPNAHALCGQGFASAWGNTVCNRPYYANYIMTAHPGPELINGGSPIAWDAYVRKELPLPTYT